MIINCHCHIFDVKCTPQKFQCRFAFDPNNPIHRLAHGLIKLLLPAGSRPAQFIDLAKMSIMEIAQKLVNEMDEAGVEICTPLMMDMEYNPVFGGGTKEFKDQLEETSKTVKLINEQSGKVRMLPFIAADPRRPDIENIVLEALGSGAFKGVKIYPVMDYSPNDKRLYGIYRYCVDNNHPITTHCANEGIPGFEAYYYKARPDYWVEVLGEFPTLTLNLAHNDRTGTSWQLEIERLIETYDNVYTDISCNFEMWFRPRKYFKNVKRMLNTDKIKDRMLYGTDWYMGRYLWDETSYLKWFSEYSRKIFWCRVSFTESEMQRLTEENPKRFLRL